MISSHYLSFFVQKFQRNSNFKFIFITSPVVTSYVPFWKRIFKTEGGSFKYIDIVNVDFIDSEPPSVLKILFQRGTYDMTTYVAKKNELKVAIPSEYFYKQPSSNEKISYNIVSLINHYGV